MITFPHEVFRLIESRDYRIRVNKASSLSHFKRDVSSADEFHALVQEITKIEGNDLHVVKRIYDLVTLDTDHRYEHPYDAAMATYLLSLEAAGSRRLVVAANLLRQSDRTWWADKISKRIIASSRNTSRARDRAYIQPSVSKQYIYPVDTTEPVRDVYTWKLISRAHSPRFEVIQSQQSLPSGSSSNWGGLELGGMFPGKTQILMFEHPGIFISPFADQMGHTLPLEEIEIDKE